MPILEPFTVKIGDVELTASPFTRAQELALFPHLANMRRRTPEDMEFIAGVIGKNVGMTAQQILEHDNPLLFWVIWDQLWSRSSLSGEQRKNSPSSSSAQAPASTSENAEATQSTANGASSEGNG